MKGFLYIPYWFLGILLISCLIVGFAVGALLKMDTAYDVGAKMAIEDIRQGTQTAYQDGQQFFWLSGIPYRMNAISENVVVIVFKKPAEDKFAIAGIGDEGKRKVWE